MIFLVATVLVAIIVSLLVLLLVGEIEGESDNGPMVSPILIADELFLLFLLCLASPSSSTLVVIGLVVIPVGLLVISILESLILSFSSLMFSK